VGDRPVHGSLLIETRPAAAVDAEAVLEVILACDVAELGEPDFTLDDVRDQWADPAIDLARDSWVVDAGGPGLAAYALCSAQSQDVYVHPGHCGRGLGGALLAVVERRAAELGHPLRQYIAERNVAAAALLTRCGYRVTHHYWRMMVDLDTPPQTAALPDGVSLREFRPGRDDRDVHALVRAAFAEIDGNIHLEYDEWRQGSIESASFDPRWWSIAVSGDEIAGVALSQLWESEGIGWVGQLAVAPRWRGQGLGRALLLTALTAFHRRGVPRAGLSVHGRNDAAARLYRSVGMRPAWRHDRFERAAAQR
jgi:mycothiol synthase